MTDSDADDIEESDSEVAKEDEEELTRPSWSECLMVLYEEEVTYVGNAHLAEDTSDIGQLPENLANQLEYSDDEIVETLGYLHQVGLVEQTSHGNDIYGLSKKGFEVAHSREINDQHLKTNRYIALFTVVLAAAAVSQVGLKVMGETLKASSIVVGSIFVAIALAAVYIEWVS